MDFNESSKNIPVYVFFEYNGAWGRAQMLFTYRINIVLVQMISSLTPNFSTIIQRLINSFTQIIIRFLLLIHSNQLNKVF